MKHLVQKLCVVISILVLAACETNLSTPDLRIVNEEALPTEMTWYSPIDIPIEIAGGEGGFNVRYIQNPEPGMSEELTEDAEGNNTISLSVVKQEGTQKNTFRLQGVPIPPAGSNLQDFESSFWIEVTDGSSTVIYRSDFAVNIISLNDVSPIVSVEEGEANLRKITGQELSQFTPCRAINDIESRSRDLGYGEAFPYAFLLKITQPVSVPVTFDYVVEEDRFAENVASSFVDFVPQTGSIVIEPGATGCAAPIYIVDDSIIEERENFKVTVTDPGNLAFSFADQVVFIQIDDDEPTIEAEELFFTVAPGDSVSIPVELNRPAESDVRISFKVNPSETNLSSFDYSLNPINQVLVVNEGDRFGVLSVSISDTLSSSVVSDPKLVIEVATDGGDEAEISAEITVNAYVNEDVLINDPTIEYQAIATSGADVFSLANSLSNAFQRARLYRYDAQGNQALLDGTNFYEFSSGGGDVSAIDVAFISAGAGYSDIALLLRTDQRLTLGASSWGGQDFAVVKLRVNDSGAVTVLAQSQHGSEVDDEVVELVITDNGEIAVSGSTEGLSLDGQSTIPPEDGREGFVYLFDGSLSLLYSRFVGDRSDNNMVGLSVDDSNVHAFVTDGAGIFSRSLDDDGFLDVDVASASLRQPAAFMQGGVANYGDDNFGVLVSSTFSKDGDATPSLTDDVFLYNLRLNEESSISNLFTIATDSNDVGRAIAFLDKEDFERVGVVGETLGEFEAGSIIGGQDLFFASVDVVATPSLLKVQQFGTAGTDYIVDLDVVGEDKFLVLWKEDHSSGDGTFRYRITPFSPDGENLLPIN
ncbi:Calx-beta domain-containing protein [Oleiphilus sp. HI0066]|uniref:Calx-beta domain-containing protein n=1 Tax=Oleiphilus sp. HI0066 TaxID=1822242 RepID=UPI0018D423B9|nr:Calx-beta domain-containing protein [Oleiphilus sp. HI0066]